VLLAIDAVAVLSVFSANRQKVSFDGVALVIFGHYGQQRQTLKKMPEYYR
jgi:hypothetical protein